MKATGALWMLVLLADAGAMAMSGTAKAMAAIVAATSVVLVVLAARQLRPSQQPVPARARDWRR